MSKMIEEIHQQPIVLEKTLRGARRAIDKLRKRVERRRPKFLVLAARGTSDNAAQFGRYLLEITTGIPVSLAAPSIFTLYRSKIRLDDALVVAVSQSGESTDTNFVLERAREMGAATVGVTNVASSTLAKLPDHTLLVRAGKERSVAATKTYTGQLLMFYLLAHALGARIQIDDLERLPEWADQALGLEPEIRDRAGRYHFMRQAVVVGRGLNYSNAFELALKLMETCYVVAERFSSADFLHGPIAMVEQSFPVFLFTPTGVTWPSLKRMLEKLHQLRAETLIVTDRGNREALEMSPRSVCLPIRLPRRRTLPEEVFTPIPYAIPAQLFSACLAEEKGLDPDQPRTLTKVTQTL